MSIQVMQAVWARDLTHSEQSVLLVFADHANDDASGARPPLGRVAWKTGYSHRQVQNIVRELRGRGWLELEAKGGGRLPNSYRIRLDLIPVKPRYEDPAQRGKAASARSRGEMVSPLEGAEGCGDFTPGVTSGVHPSGETQVSPKTSLDVQDPPPACARATPAVDNQPVGGDGREGEAWPSAEKQSRRRGGQWLVTAIGDRADVAIAGPLRRRVVRLLGQLEQAGWGADELVDALTGRELASADEPAAVLLTRARDLVPRTPPSHTRRAAEAEQAARAAEAAAEAAAQAELEDAIAALPDTERARLLERARGRLPPLPSARALPDDHPTIRALARELYTAERQPCTSAPHGG